MDYKKYRNAIYNWYWDFAIFIEKIVIVSKGDCDLECRNKIFTLSAASKSKQAVMWHRINEIYYKKICTEIVFDCVIYVSQYYHNCAKK